MLDRDLTDAAPATRVLLAVARDAVRRATPSRSRRDAPEPWDAAGASAASQSASDATAARSPASSDDDAGARRDGATAEHDESGVQRNDAGSQTGDAGSQTGDADSAGGDDAAPPYGDVGPPPDDAATAAGDDADGATDADANAPIDASDDAPADADGSDARTDARADARADWTALRDLARRHAFEPLCYRYLEQRADAGDALPLDGDVPPTVREDLAAAAGSTARQNERFAAVLLRTWSVLDDADVRALAVKGPVLATVAYDDLGLRRFGDLDLLVVPADVPDAVAALREAGFALETDLGPFDAADLPDGDGGVAAPSSVQLRAPETDVVVDLVYRHADVVGDAHLDVRSLWRNRCAVAVADGQVPALSPTDRLVLLALHGTSHGWERLLDLTDLAAVASAADADWDAALSRATERDARSDLLLGALLAAEVLDAEVPAGVLGEARADDRVEPVARSLEHRFVRDPAYHPSCFANHRLRARLYGDAATRTARVLSRPTLADYRCAPLPRPLWPCYRLVVPVRLALQALRER